jgi:hypothetical protein
MKKLLIILGLVSIGFTSVPKCSSDDARDVVAQILNEVKTDPSNLYAALIPKYKNIEGIRTTRYDKEINLRKCRATANFENDFSAIIEYDVYITEDKPEDFYVEISQESLQAIIQQSLMQRIMNKK